MDLNLTTFVLEIVNFLVLVWILKRFLYKPVLNVIAKRRKFIDETLENSKQLKNEAESAKKQYENRLADWEQELRQARETLATEINQERQQKLEELTGALENERKKALVKDEKEHARAIREIEIGAMRLGAEFASRILSKTTGSDLEKKLIELLLDESSSLTSAQLNALRQRWGTPLDSIKVSSAFSLSEQHRSRLTKSLSRILDHKTSIEFKQNPELLAGLQIELGSWSLGLNIRDELKGFAELHHVTK